MLIAHDGPHRENDTTGLLQKQSGALRSDDTELVKNTHKTLERLTMHQSNQYKQREADGRNITTVRSDVKTLINHATADKYQTLKANPSILVFVMCMSRRGDFERRFAIRQSWKRDVENAAFFVGETACEIPSQVRTTPWSCTPKREPNHKEMQQYQKELHEEQLRLERERDSHQDMILLAMKDFYRALPKKLKLAYEWSVKNTQAQWFLKIDDDAVVRIGALESFLGNMDARKMYVIGSIRRQAAVPKSGKWAEPDYTAKTYPPFANGAEGHVVSRKVAERIHAHDGFEYQGEDVSLGIWISEMKLPVIWKDVTGKFVNNGNCHNENYIVIGHDISPAKMQSCFQSKKNTVARNRNHLETKHAQKWNIEMVNVSILDTKHRFDIIVKTAYALFLSKQNVPSFVQKMYNRHLQVWNNFKEPCTFIGESDWFDATRPCNKKQSDVDFHESFKKLYQSVSVNGFDYTKSTPPVTVSHFALNGAHRIATAIALRAEEIPIQRIHSSRVYDWGYKFFLSSGMETHYTDFAMLQWASHVKNVTIVLFWPEAVENKNKMLFARKMVHELCGPVMYEKSIFLNRHGISILAKHSYGEQEWLMSKVKQLQSVFRDETTKLETVVLFVAPKSDYNLRLCKHKIRLYFDLTNPKSAMHIPDHHKETVILSRAVLNENSVFFMNSNGKDECLHVAAEIANRLSLRPVNPNVFLLPEDIMVDSGAVMSFFGLRDRTDVDLLFQGSINPTVIGNKNGMHVQEHAFEHNKLKKNERAWGKEHIFSCPVDELFTNPQYYGFCYGIKYVSLQQLISYKKKRGEIGKDEVDVKRVQDFLHAVSTGITHGHHNSESNTMKKISRPLTTRVSGGGTLTDSIKPILITQGHHDAEINTMKKISRLVTRTDGGVSETIATQKISSTLEQGDLVTANGYVNVLVFVLSHSNRKKDGVSGPERRMAIRNTWKKSIPANSLFWFVLDQGSNDDMRENETYSDMLFLDTLQQGQAVGFGIKLKKLTQWALSKYKFDAMMRIDDDNYMCMDHLLHDLKTVILTSRNFVWGWWFGPRMSMNEDHNIQGPWGQVADEFCSVFSGENNARNNWRPDEMAFIVGYDVLKTVFMQSKNGVTLPVFDLMDETLMKWLRWQNVTYVIDNSRFFRGQGAYTPKLPTPVDRDDFCDHYISFHKAHPTAMAKLWQRQGTKQYKQISIHPKCISPSTSVSKFGTVIDNQAKTHTPAQTKKRDQISDTQATTNSNDKSEARKLLSAFEKRLDMDNDTWMGVKAKTFGSDEQRAFYRLFRFLWKSKMYPLDVKSKQEFHTEPNWGSKRGHPIGRYYLHRWLEQKDTEIQKNGQQQARCLEIGDGHFVKDNRDRAWKQRPGKMIRSCSDTSLSLDLSDPRADLHANLESPFKTLKEKSKLHELQAGFDIIVCAQVFEHIDFPLQAMKGLASLLRVDGVILFSVPFISNPVHGHDVHRFTKTGVENLAKAAGLAVISNEQMGNSLTTIGYLLDLSSDDFTEDELLSKDDHQYVGVYSVLKKIKHSDLVPRFASNIFGTSGKSFSGKIIRKFDPSSIDAGVSVEKIDVTMVRDNQSCVVWAVVTTIFDPSDAVKMISSHADFCLVVVLDKKSRPEAWDAMNQMHNVHVLSVKEQERLFPVLSSLLPWNHFGRKNIGYIFAITMGADAIWDFDDDNIGIPSIKIPKTAMEPTGGHKTVNPYPYFGTHETRSWPRGLPFDDIKNELPQNIKTKLHEHKVGVIQNLANIEPDVDAVYRFTREVPFNFTNSDAIPFLVPKHSFSPFNAQATLWFKCAFRFMLLPITVHGRVSDIWRSYIAQSMFQHEEIRTLFVFPYIVQKRNPHQNKNDFAAENPLYEQAGALVDVLQSEKNKSLKSLYESLYERGFLDLQDVKLLQAWENIIAPLSSHS